MRMGKLLNLIQKWTRRIAYVFLVQCEMQQRGEYVDHVAPNGFERVRVMLHRYCLQNKVKTRVNKANVLSICVHHVDMYAYAWILIYTRKPMHHKYTYKEPGTMTASAAAPKTRSCSSHCAAAARGSR